MRFFAFYFICYSIIVFGGDKYAKQFNKNIVFFVVAIFFGFSNSYASLDVELKKADSVVLEKANEDHFNQLKKNEMSDEKCDQPASEALTYAISRNGYTIFCQGQAVGVIYVTGKGLTSDCKIIIVKRFRKQGIGIAAEIEFIKREKNVGFGIDYDNVASLRTLASVIEKGNFRAINQNGGSTVTANEIRAVANKVSKDKRFEFGVYVYVSTPEQ